MNDHTKMLYCIEDTTPVIVDKQVSSFKGNKIYLKYNNEQPKWRTKQQIFHDTKLKVKVLWFHCLSSKSFTLSLHILSLIFSLKKIFLIYESKFIDKILRIFCETDSFFNLSSIFLLQIQFIFLYLTFVRKINLFYL